MTKYYEFQKDLLKVSLKPPLIQNEDGFIK